MKTDNKIPLKRGYLTFLNDRIEISDNSRIEMITILIVFFCTSIYGLICVISYTSTESPIMYYSGIGILLTWVFSTPLLIMRSYGQVLYYNEIGKINLTENFDGGLNATFNLKKGKTRFVYLNNNKNNISLFMKKLKELQLESDVTFQIAWVQVLNNKIWNNQNDTFFKAKKSNLLNTYKNEYDLYWYHPDYCCLPRQ